MAPRSIRKTPRIPPFARVAEVQSPYHSMHQEANYEHVGEMMGRVLASSRVTIGFGTKWRDECYRIRTDPDRVRI
jgi:hypothetical protein